jgi:hypothetical protein
LQTLEDDHIGNLPRSLTSLELHAHASNVTPAGLSRLPKRMIILKLPDSKALQEMSPQTLDEYLPPFCRSFLIGNRNTEWLAKAMRQRALGEHCEPKRRKTRHRMQAGCPEIVAEAVSLHVHDTR